MQVALVLQGGGALGAYQVGVYEALHQAGVEPNWVIGTSIGAIGTALAQEAMRGVLGFCNSPQMNAIEAYIQFKPGLITDDGEVTVPETEEFLRNYITEFGNFIERVYTALPRTT